MHTSQENILLLEAFLSLRFANVLLCNIILGDLPKMWEKRRGEFGLMQVLDTSVVCGSSPTALILALKIYLRRQQK